MYSLKHNRFFFFKISARSSTAVVTWSRVYKHRVTSSVYSHCWDSSGQKLLHSRFSKWRQKWKDLSLSKRLITINTTITICLNTRAMLVVKGDPRGRSSWTQTAIVPLDMRGRLRKSITTARWNAGEPRARRLDGFPRCLQVIALCVEMCLFAAESLVCSTLGPCGGEKNYLPFGYLHKQHPAD